MLGLSRALNALVAWDSKPMMPNLMPHGYDLAATSIYAATLLTPLSPASSTHIRFHYHRALII